MLDVTQRPRRGSKRCAPSQADWRNGMVPTSRKKFRWILGERPTSTRALENMAPSIFFLTVLTARSGGTVITVTSRAGKDSRGFSLLELLLVVCLLGLSSLVVLPTIEAGLRQRELRRSALALAATARDLRSRALQTGIPQQLVLRIAENSYQVTVDHEIYLPAQVKFAEVGGGETLDNST